jgi:hypothetical protein
METYRNQSLQTKSFILEEVAFIDCVLNNCDLYYSGGEFDWANTTFENCRFHWRGAAKNTLALLQLTGMMPAPVPRPEEESKAPAPKIN